MTIVCTFQDGVPIARRFGDPANAKFYAEQVERAGGRAGIVRNGRVLREAGSRALGARPISPTGDCDERF